MSAQLPCWPEGRFAGRSWNLDLDRGLIATKLRDTLKKSTQESAGAEIELGFCRRVVGLISTSGIELRTSKHLPGLGNSRVGTKRSNWTARVEDELIAA